MIAVRNRLVAGVIAALIASAIVLATTSFTAETPVDLGGTKTKLVVDCGQTARAAFRSAGDGGWSFVASRDRVTMSGSPPACRNTARTRLAIAAGLVLGATAIGVVSVRRARRDPAAGEPEPSALS
jgi:hypothetical protein